MKVVSLFGRQFSSWFSSTEDGSVGHVSRGEQKAQTASQKSPWGIASACGGLIELGSCDRVPRNDGVEADKRFFSYAAGNKRHTVL